jgi:hypothetical protein
MDAVKISDDDLITQTMLRERRQTRRAETEAQLDFKTTWSKK